MKKFCFALVFLFVFGALTPLFAQKVSPEHESDYYYFNVPLERIYPCRAGYIVVYRRGVDQMTKAYLPSRWFEKSAGKGEVVVLPPGTSWPFMTVYYKAGEFSHVRLSIHRWKGHPTWGYVPLTVNVNDQFEGVESIELKF